MSWAGFNVAVCALRFFYGVTLGRSAMVDRIPYARKRRQLPVILSADEVVQFLAAVPNLKHRTALMTAYAAGLRVSEVVQLKIADSARLGADHPAVRFRSIADLPGS
jgi:integrase/recombinase XerD